VGGGSFPGSPSFQELLRFKFGVKFLRQHCFQFRATQLRSDLPNPLVDLLRIHFTPNEQIVQVPLQRPVQHRPFVKVANE
jgi:hypothetical protein